MDGAPPPPPPPPPPPHGDNPKSSGLPNGNYDIFIIPPHSSGSGFLYLPSLQTHRNSFLAGVAATLLAVGMWTIIAPVLRHWLSTMVATGGAGVLMLIAGVGIAGWAWGKTQTENAGPGPDGGTGGGIGSGAHTTGGGRAGHQQQRSQSNTYPSGGPQPRATPSASSGAGSNRYGYPPETGPNPKPSWQRASSGPADGGAASGWEKAREETRKKEEERRRQEELKRRREELQKAREEADKTARVAAEKEKWEKARAREKETREREARERIVRERLAKEKETKEKTEKEVREKQEKDGVKPSGSSPTKSRPSAASSPTKKYEKATAESYIGTEDEAHSFRPYDTPKRPAKMASQSSVSGYSESSYAASQSTARTTPPPSHRGPYSTKDPDKIVIKAVYLFNDLFPKPVAQLVSGVGSVTDGLIMRITTEGLFVDDDVRGVGQREWDVKAWGMKLVEVWCPLFAALAPSSAARNALKITHKDPLARFSSAGVKISQEETDLLVEKLHRSCKSSCGHLQSANASVHSSQQSAEVKAKGLHVLRASIRDTEGKKYVFVLEEAEGWKVAVGLQRLRRGSQVRALGVSGLPAADLKGILAITGWG
ncbi:hypothetical protein BJ546DRAFT_951378 [Cryomyces antarcticus]